MRHEISARHDDISFRAVHARACELPQIRLAYITDAGSGTVSAYDIDPTGAIALRNPDGVAAQTGAGSGPADAALSAGGRFLYTRNGGNGTIGAFRVNGDGTLTALSTIGGLPSGANGLVAR